MTGEKCQAICTSCIAKEKKTQWKNVNNLLRQQNNIIFDSFLLLQFEYTKKIKM
jgi:hypothetical protein